MTKTQFLKKLLAAVEAELFSDSNISKSVEIGKSKGETDEQLVLRALKTRKGTSKILRFMDTHKFTVDIDFTTISKEGLETEVVEKGTPEIEPEHIIEIPEIKEENLAPEATTKDIIDRVKSLFIENVYSEFQTDSKMIKLIDTGKKADEKDSILIERILRCRPRSKKVENIADNLGIIILWQNNQYRFDLASSKLKDSIILGMIQKEPECAEIKKDSVKPTVYKYYFDEKKKIAGKDELLSCIKDIVNDFANDSLVQKAILTEVSKKSTDADIVNRCFRTRQNSMKMINIAHKYNLYLVANTSSTVFLMSGSHVLTNTLKDTLYVDTKDTGAIKTGKTMQELAKEKVTKEVKNTFKEDKDANELKKEVYGNIIEDMFDKDAIPFISEQINEIFKSDSVVKKSLLVSEKNREGIVGKILRARKIRPSSKPLKELLEKIKCEIDVLDDFKYISAESMKSEHIDNNTKTLEESIKYQITSTSVTVYEPNGDVHNASVSHPEYHNIIKALEEKKYKEALILISKVKAVEENLNVINDNLSFVGQNKKIIIKNKMLYVIDETTKDEQVMQGTLASFIISLSTAQSIRYESALKFMLKMVENNMDETSMDGLFNFLMNARIPINQEGNILTYKLIRDDYKDCYTGKIDNSVGATVTMERSKVTYDPRNTCASGLHVCSYSYLNHYSGSKIVICEVEPHDVVSVPIDYHYAKMRCCKYKVVEEVPRNTGDVLAKREDCMYIGKDHGLNG